AGGRTAIQLTDASLFSPLARAVVPRAHLTGCCALMMVRFVALARGVLVIATVGLAACGVDRSSREKPSGARLVFKDAAGRELTTDDLKQVSGQVSWEVIGADTVPPEASRLHAEAREAGGRGDYQRALTLLEQ